VVSTGVVDLKPGERMPIRLVQENGETISLNATSVDIVVERQVSNFGIPFFDAKKMGIDLNQAAVAIEVQGVFTDETGQEETVQSQAIIDFYQPQSLITENPNAGKGGGMSEKEKSIYNQKKSSGEQTGRGAKESGKGLGLGGGISRPSTPLVIPALGNTVLDDWQTRYIDFPVAYWVEQNQALDNPNKTNLQLWLKGENYSDGTWTDASGFARNATQSTAANKPLLRENGVNGKTGVFFDGTNDYLEIPFATNLNSNEFTIFVVARATDTGDKPILDSATNGYGLSLDVQSTFTNSDFTARWVDTGGADSKDSSAFTIGLRKYDAAILGYTMEDTNSDNTSDTVKIYFNGASVGTETSGVDYTGASSGVLRIGYDGSNYFKGDIYEVLIYNSILSDDDRQNVEGYLARKYALNLIMGKYSGTGRYSNQVEHIRVVFDNKLLGSKVESYGFLNQRRRASTQQAINSMRINQGSPPNTLVSTITVDGDPRTWFETSSPRRHRITFSASETGYPTRQTSGGEDYYGEVVSVTSSTITVHFNKTGGTHADNDYIFIEPVDYGNANFVGTDVAPVIVLPINNADTYVRGNLSEDAVGPTHPNFQDGSARNTTHGSDITRTDEYIAFLLSKALTADYMRLGRDIDKSSITPTMDNVYSVALSESYNGHNARLSITQKYATSLGQKNKIVTDLGAGQIPVIQDFSGGKAGKKVKSAGDKVQDLFGVLANSNNFLNIQNSKSAFIDSVLDVTTGFVQQTVYDNDDAKGDYIRGIQIPYNSLATKGKDTLDSEVAQRNFFLTTNNARTSDKMSSVNTIHASRDFSHISEGHEKNGISGLISDFNVNRDAEMKAYEFSLMFVAADIIL
jgi:hypothetical protein